MGGLMYITGFPGTPTKAGPGVGDIFPATLAALGIVSAVRHAERTGQGQLVDVAMYDAVLSLCERMVYQHSYTGEVPGQPGNGHPLLSPFGVFEAADGWIALAAPGDENWRRTCERLDAPELATDPRFSSAAARVANNAATQAELNKVTRRYRKAEIVERLAGFVPVGPVNTAADIFADGYAKARDMLVEVEQPGGARNVVLAGTPIKFTETPTRPLTRGPLLGEHTDSVLARAGYTADQISALREARAVR
jgi:crotonobetainyl-CoA:carnitine CoA-transferase CaiB-like acyl-CoA transferase